MVAAWRYTLDMSKQKIPHGWHYITNADLAFLTAGGENASVIINSSDHSQKIGDLL